MRKLAVVVTSGIVLGGMTVGSPSAWAHGHSHGSSGDGDFTVYGRFTDFDKQDNGEEGWSEDDVVTFAYDLFEKGAGRVGDGDGECTITELNKDEHDFSADCEGVFDLEDGELDLKGTITDEDFKSGEIELDVIGGDGDYRDADGTVTFSKPDHDGKSHDKGSYHTAHAGEDHGDKMGHGGDKGRGGDKMGHGDKRHGKSHGDKGRGHWFKADVDLD
jgi:hypothetical protein